MFFFKKNKSKSTIHFCMWLYVLSFLQTKDDYLSFRNKKYKGVEKITMRTWSVICFPIFFDKFSNFSISFHSFRSFEKQSKNRLRRDDSFGPKIVQIGAILAIFQPFEIFRKKLILIIYVLGVPITDGWPNPHFSVHRTNFGFYGMQFSWKMAVRN